MFYEHVMIIRLPTEKKTTLMNWYELVVRHLVVKCGGKPHMHRMQSEIKWNMNRFLIAFLCSHTPPQLVFVFRILSHPPGTFDSIFQGHSTSFSFPHTLVSSPRRPRLLLRHFLGILLKTALWTCRFLMSPIVFALSIFEICFNSLKTIRILLKKYQQPQWWKSHGL